MRRPLFILSLGMLVGCAAASTDLSLPGSYRLAEGPDVAGELEIAKDGRFRYFLAAGALDETAQGRWQSNGSAACLFTEPRPVPPVFSRRAGRSGEERMAKLEVTWPDGRGIAGVDFRLGLDDGRVIDGYTQDDGWTMAPDEARRPRWVELAVPMHGLQSARFPLEAADGGPWRFVLTPNDLGVVDFQGACLRREGSFHVLDRDGAAMRFVRSDH